ncbi:MAG TPA: transglutaminase family protein [Caulobacter sp.]|nr:transglutaminase family protein [Caulobacter sp.]
MIAGSRLVTRLTITHETRYGYERPVAFGPQKLLLRPRDSHATRVVEASLITSVPGSTRWIFDALGNCVCLFTPEGQSDRLTITSRLVIDRYPAPLAYLRPEDPHTAMPIVYPVEDRIALAPFITPVLEDPDGAVFRWIASQLRSNDEPALDFLLRLNRAIHEGFAYEARCDAGVQTPARTLALRRGACRDFAWLMVESLRWLGYATLFVTGYVNSGAMRGAGSTHAWCEVFLPGLGWTEFDPTNGIAESADLIRVAVSRRPQEAAPVTGVILGDPGATTLDVHVDVTPDTLSVAA